MSAEELESLRGQLEADFLITPLPQHCENKCTHPSLYEFILDVLLPVDNS